MHSIITLNLTVTKTKRCNGYSVAMTQAVGHKYKLKSKRYVHENRAPHTLNPKRG